MDNISFSHRPPRTWLKITLQVPCQVVDSASSFLANLTGIGVEHQMLPPSATKPTHEMISGYLLQDKTLLDKKNQLHHFLNHLAGQFPQDSPITTSEEFIEEEDWGKTWKAHFKPIRLSKRIVIKPSWEDYESANTDDIVIDIDPGMAFGTGHHASTRLALELLEQCYEKNGPQTVLDVGTGTAILGLACSLLGAHSVLGIDNDQDAVAAARENIKRNKLEKIMTVQESTSAQQSGSYQLILANITHDTLVELAPDLKNLLQPSGSLILAGILRGEQADSIKKIYTRLGLSFAAERGQEEWAAFRFIR